MNRRFFLTSVLALTLTTFASCGKRTAEADGADDTLSASWVPEGVTMAKHISSVHDFVIGSQEDAFLKVSKTDDGKINAALRPDILEKLGGEKVMFVIGWESNPSVMSRSDYLFFLEALHGYLAFSAPEWRGEFADK